MFNKYRKTMINCTVCQTANDEFSIVCKKCGGFLQNRVPNLDLFDVLWKIIESPRSAFRTIILSEHKNYTVFLYSLTGIAIIFAEFWHFKLGERIENILLIIFFGIVIGIPFGIVLCPIVTSLHWGLTKLLGMRTSFRNSLGITSYSLTPIIISMIVVLPVELSTFGMYLFTFNPPPITIKPISYIVLIGLDVIFAVWAWVLMVVGTNVGNLISVWKSVLLSLLVYGIIIVGIIFGGHVALKLI